MATSYRELPFAEALKFFRQKVPLPTQVWDDLAGEAQDWAFTVAGVTSAQLLQRIFELTDEAIAAGTPYSEFKERFDDYFARSGFEPLQPWRAQLVLLQNLRQSYGAGRYRQMTEPETLKRSPFWQWIHDDPITPRPHHQALHEKVFRADAPFWQTCYPPDGFGCRCRVFRLSQRQLEREGLQAEAAPTPQRIRDKKTGEVKNVPVVMVDGVPHPVADPGFEAAPGASQQSRRQQILAKQMERLHPRLQEQVKQGLESQWRYELDKPLQPGEYFPKMGVVLDSNDVLLVDVEALTYHANVRANSRKLSRSEVLKAFDNPIIVLEQSGKRYLFITREVVAGYDPRTKRVTTTYDKRNFDPQIRGLIRRYDSRSSGSI